MIERDMKKTVKKRKKRANSLRRAATSAAVPRDASKRATVDLYRAAETLAAGKGHKATDAARRMLEAAAALGVITVRAHM
jgi:hypothetical protein